MKHEITKALISYLEDRRIYFRPNFSYGDALGKRIFVNENVFAESYARLPENAVTWGNVSVGCFTYIVPGCFLENTTIGRYCSIATNVKVMGENHPTDRVSTSTWTYGNNVADIVKKDFLVEIKQNRQIRPAPPTQIGNDVWIGEGVTLKKGVKIGDGAIIGAKAVVAKDIPAYSVAVGNPVRVIKYRFSKDIIDQLNEIKWWNIHPSVLAGLDMVDVDKFLLDVKLLRSEPSYKSEKIDLANAFKKINNSNEIF